MSANSKLKIVGDAKEIGDEELRIWLDSYIKKHPHLNTEVLSRTDHIGVSRTALDGYLQGTYFTSKDAGGFGVNPATSKIEPKIRAYREKVEGSIRQGYTNSFLQTRSWQQFQHACKTAIEENAIVVVYGNPGLGKSRCLMEYKTAKMSTLPISILCSANVTTRFFGQEIARELGLNHNKSIPEVEKNICEKLSRNPRPLFVDQANYLNEKALGTICHIWEKARIPIVLIGTKDLYELFTTSRLTQDVRSQLSSRVAMHYPLLELSVEEVKAIVSRALGSQATDEVIAKFYNLTHGNHRHLDMMIPRVAATAQANEEGINNGQIALVDIIQNAATRIIL